MPATNPSALASDPVLARYRGAVEAAFGTRIERIVLFGSRARGDARPDSDYDVALFLTDLNDCWTEVRRVVDIQQAIRDETGADIHTTPIPAGSWRNSASALMHEIRKDGIDL
jgi:predicted nucleotidyltransferase